MKSLYSLSAFLIAALTIISCAKESTSSQLQHKWSLVSATSLKQAGFPGDTTFALPSGQFYSFSATTWTTESGGQTASVSYTLNGSLITTSFNTFTITKITNQELDLLTDGNMETTFHLTR